VRGRPASQRGDRRQPAVLHRQRPGLERTRPSCWEFAGSRSRTSLSAASGYQSADASGSR
jgi:hypothetical protein